MNRQIKDQGGIVAVEDIVHFSMEHTGYCYRNSKLNPASAEESMATTAAKDLLMDQNGAYIGDDLAIFCLECHSDNDTRASQAIIKAQNEFIGLSADDLGDHLPDLGHVIKNLSNLLFKLRDVDTSLRGVNCLHNLRIKAIVRDVRKVIDWYRETGVGDDAARQEAITQINATVLHHCGDHSLCVHERFCSYLKVKKQHPDWEDHSIRKEAHSISKRALRGKEMSLNAKGIAKVTALLLKKVNANNIDKIASDGCSNLSESFWSQTTKFSEGKRLNQDHADAYIAVNELTFCRVGEGNIEKTHDDVSNQLSLKVTTPEVKHQIKARKTRNRIKKYQSTEDFKQKRMLAKLTKLYRSGKEDAKKAHRSGKVPVEECAKSNIKKIEKDKARKVITCSNCKLMGHNASKCKLPKYNKRPNVELTDYELEDFEIKMPKKLKLDLVAADDWVM